MNELGGALDGCGGFILLLTGASVLFLVVAGASVFLDRWKGKSDTTDRDTKDG
jgi:hypothetical protein